MKTINDAAGMRDIALFLKKQNEKIGFVPTMGYLHRGHLSLMDRARKECTKVIISIFVNPIQFGPDEDFNKYPRDLEHDSELAKKAGVDYIFYPGTGEMYGRDFITSVNVRGLNKIMCGKYRPIHFNGVCTVVLKLLNIIQPDIAYFGQKDYQQLVIIKRMVHDLNVFVEISACPTIREEDGLAMSSRNKYLSSAERKDAVVLFKSLNMAAEFIRNGCTELWKIKKHIKDTFKENNSVKKIDYFEFRDAENLDLIKDINKYSTDKPGSAILIASAIWIGKTRLIDNIIVKPGSNHRFTLQ